MTAAAWLWDGFPAQEGQRYEVTWPSQREAERLRERAESIEWGEVPLSGYTRISDDKLGDEHGVANQRETYIPQAARTHKVDEPERWYDDNDKSAVDPRVFRPGFHELCADLDRGKINGVIVQNVDRLVRRNDDLQVLFNIYDRAKLVGRRIRPIMDTERSYDLHTAADRMAMQLKVLIGDNEVQNTRRRTTDSHLTRAKQGGVPGGIRAFGWTEGRRALDPDESQAIREAVFAMVEGDAGWSSIARKWNAAGLLTPFAGRERKSGESFSGEWLSGNVRATLSHPRNAGYRTHRGKIVYTDDGDPVMGQWPAILSQDEWKVFYDLIAGQNRSTSKKPLGSGTTHLLSGILRCGKCRAKMQGGWKSRADGGVRLYKCPSKGAGGCAGTVIRAEIADVFVTTLVLKKMEERTASKAASTDWAGADELHELEERASLLHDRLLKPGAMNAAKLLDTIEELDARVAELRQERARAEMRRERQVRTATSTQEAWPDLSLARKRASILDVVAAVLVKPSSPRPKGTRPGWIDTDRLVPIPAEE